MLKKIAVIGLGNTLRRDDGIGIIVLESLLKHYKRPGVDYLNFGIASFDLMHRLEKYQTVLLIDGIEAPLAPGELKIFKLEDIAYDADPLGASTHELDLKSLFELYKNFKLKTKVFIAGIQVKNTDWKEGLSTSLKKSFNKNLKEISEFIDVLCHTGKS